MAEAMKKRTIVLIRSIEIAVVDHVHQMTVYEAPELVQKAIEKMLKAKGFSTQRPRLQTGKRKETC